MDWGTSGSFADPIMKLTGKGIRGFNTFMNKIELGTGLYK